jgi:hypothetical protein
MEEERQWVQAVRAEAGQESLGVVGEVVLVRVDKAAFAHLGPELALHLVSEDHLEEVEAQRLDRAE